MRTSAATAAAAETRGLPFIRTYPLDEIGNVPRGLRLGFDSFGRVAVMYDGIYSVLNDIAWVSRIDASAETKIRMTTIRVADGKYYYGGRGSWGTVDLTPDGRFRACPLVPTDAPGWTSVTPFNGFLNTPTGVYFYEVNGVVYWDFARQKNFFFELPRVASVFRVGDRVFASCQDHVLREILPQSGSVHVAEVSGLDGAVAEFAAPLDSSHTLLALQDGRLVTFDGRGIAAWSPQTALHLTGKISSMERLIGGGVAIAYSGKGIFLVSPEGAMLWSLTLPEFHSIGAMAAGESGVLWVAGENAVHKILYDSPLTNFGQQLGLPIVWPKITWWDDRIMACSNGILYALAPSTSGTSARFEPLSESPHGQIECLAAQGDLFFVGTSTGVYSAGRNGRFTQVASIENVARLEFIQPDICLVIGTREIAALRQIDGNWIEAAPRIAGVGDASIRTTKHGAVWIEMGGDRVARLTYRDGVLKLQRVELPWNGAQWTNVGVVGDLVVISGTKGQRAYYNESGEDLCSAPELDRLLNRSPYWISRITEDATGRLWATHAQGVVTFTPTSGDYLVDSTTFELRNDSYPTVTILPGDNIWVSTGRSLYHVEQQSIRATASPHAVLVSLLVDNQNLELLNQTGANTPLPHLSFDDNSLSFRLFSGTYAWRFPPLYEYRLGQTEPWTRVDPNLLLHFPKLRDGVYRLEVRSAGPDSTKTPAFALDFVIQPPWYRTPTSYVVYGLLLLMTIVGLVRWTNHQSLKRNVELERLVYKRTAQLEDAMEKLNEETRNAATMAERSRLAGEIHDSLQQGLSGSILQLDTTMNHGTVAPEVRSRLDVVRKMLSYAREEVQHAVWNLESPLLEDSNLGDALGKLAGFINSGSIEMNVVLPGEPVTLEPAVQHHLLRIAQEAITNAVKHANANRIDVRLQTNPGAVSLTISDDGVGFNLTPTSRIDGHFGLRGMRMRARSIRAELSVNSSAGTGTTIQVTVPLNQSAFHDHNGQSKST